MRTSVKKILSLGLAAAMTVGLGAGITAPVAEAAQVPAANVASYTQRPYHAYVCFQTSLYSYRNEFDADEEGVISTDKHKKTLAEKVYPSLDSTQPGVAESSFDWSKMFFWNAPYGTETSQFEFRDLDGDGAKDKYTIAKEHKYLLQTADFESPDISYDGTYTASMKNFPADTFKDDRGFRLLYVDTTIPYSQPVQFTNVILKVDGVQLYTAPVGITRNTNDSKNTYHLMVINEYGYNDYGFPTKQSEKSSKDGVPDHIWEAAKTNGGQFNMPKSSIEITFTISGLGAAPDGYVRQDDNSSAASAPAITAATVATPTSLAKGETFSVKGLKYKVTKAGDENTAANVAVVGLNAASKKKASLSVPKSVSKDDFKYTVTAINSKAFANCKKLKTISLGSTVTTIQKNAFSNCTKLNKMKIQGKLKKVASGAFKGCKKQIKVTGSSKKANIKALKKSGYKKFK